MSSHHFVREGQEPPVIVAGDHIHAELLGSVLEWSPKVMAIGYEAACLLMADSIKVDECHLLQGQESPRFPYEVDIHFSEASACEEIVGQWMEAQRQPYYLFGWRDERIIAFFKSQTTDLAQLITGISADKKWIHPGNRRFNKWMKKGTALQLTGKASDWLVEGSTEISWPRTTITEDGLLTLQTNQLEIFAEPLYL